MKRIYNESRRRLQTHPNRANWCSYTRDCLEKLGMADVWASQELPPEWSELVREKVRQLEKTLWWESMARRPKLDAYRR